MITTTSTLWKPSRPLRKKKVINRLAFIQNVAVCLLWIFLIHQVIEHFTQNNFTLALAAKRELAENLLALLAPPVQVPVPNLWGHSTLPKALKNILGRVFYFWSTKKIEDLSCKAVFNLFLTLLILCNHFKNGSGQIFNIEGSLMATIADHQAQVIRIFKVIW